MAGSLGPWFGQSGLDGLHEEASLLSAKGTTHLRAVSAGCGWSWGGPQWGG